MAQINTIIVLRNDSSTAWESSTYKLQKGEVGIEYVPYAGAENAKTKLKIGDGEHTWAELPYFGGEEAKYFEVDSLDKITDTDLTVGDVAVVKKLIAGDKYSYTGYTWNGTDWAAMDGNYSASNVFLESKITLSGDYGKDSAKHSITTIGNMKIGDEIDAGTSLQDVLKKILAKTLQPADPTNPAATIKLYNGSATAEAGAVEVGTTFTPRFAASLSAGSYTYGPATGVTASTYSVESVGRKTVKDATNDTKEDTATTASGTFDSFVVDEDTNYKVKVTITHGEGAVAHDNLGGLSDPQKKVAAGSKTDDSTAVTGFRGCFYGYYSEKKLTPSALTSAQVRALCTAPKTTLDGFLTYDNTNKYYYITTNKMQQIFFAAPKGKYTSVAVANSTNGAPQTVTKITDVDVEGANGFAAADYDVWYVDNAGAESGETKFKVTIK
jgi:hypothetical protein